MPSASGSRAGPANNCRDAEQNAEEKENVIGRVVVYEIERARLGCLMAWMFAFV